MYAVILFYYTFVSNVIIFFMTSSFSCSGSSAFILLMNCRSEDVHAAMNSFWIVAFFQRILIFFISFHTVANCTV